jgi:hypothetical protein
MQHTQGRSLQCVGSSIKCGSRAWSNSACCSGDSFYWYSTRKEGQAVEKRRPHIWSWLRSLSWWRGGGHTSGDSCCWPDSPWHSGHQRWLRQPQAPCCSRQHLWQSCGGPSWHLRSCSTAHRWRQSHPGHLGQSLGGTCNIEPPSNLVSFTANLNSHCLR